MIEEYTYFRSLIINSFGITPILAWKKTLLYSVKNQLIKF